MVVHVGNANRGTGSAKAREGNPEQFLVHLMDRGEKAMPRKKTNEVEPVEQVLENPEANFAVEDRPITNSEANSVQGPFDYSYFPSEQKVEEPAQQSFPGIPYPKLDEIETAAYYDADVHNTATRWEVSLSIVRWLAVTGTIVYAIHRGFFEFLYSVIR